MRHGRGWSSLALVATLLLGLALPAAAAPPGKPAAAMDVTNGCAGAVYSWENQKKGVVAQIEVRPDGRLVHTFSYAVTGSSGSVTIGDFEFVQGQHYTLFGMLRDSAGRSISQSGAVWWGYCIP